MSKDAISNADAAAKDIKKTGIFGAVAATCLVITGIVHFAGGPAKIEEYGKVGLEFYPDFDDATKVTALDVYAVSAEAVEQKFRVEQLPNGRWVIPSHHSYPADAQEQLADTASSVIGIKRGGMVTRWSSDHEKYGVVNPKQRTLTASEVDGVGKRISLENKKGKVLVDFIVGKEVEDKPGSYYVRHPKEDEVYITKLDINLTTKFTEWIESDLFDVQSTNVVSLTALDHKFEETGRELILTGTETTTISRPKSADPWTTEGLDAEKEEINTQVVNEVLSTVSGLAVAGVRPKQEGLTPDLELVVTTNRDYAELRIDLQDRGFYLQPPVEGGPNKWSLFPREGELRIATDAGLVYAMMFGRVFTGSTEELEIGIGEGADKKGKKAKKDKNEKKDEKKDEDDKAKDGDSGDEDADSGDQDAEKKPNEQPGRYVFVRVTFDKQFIGEEVAQPVEPEMPAELKDAPAPKEGEEDPLKNIRTAYQDAQFQYQTDKRAYDAFVKKISDGIEKADELNARFAEWYYVVSGEEYNKLKLARVDYVQEKKPDLGPGGAGHGLPPNFPNIEGLLPPGGTPPLEGPPNPGPEDALEDAPRAPNPGPPNPGPEDAPSEEGDTPAAEGDKPAAEGDTPVEGDTPAVEGDKPAAEAEGDKPADGD